MSRSLLLFLAACSIHDVRTPEQAPPPSSELRLSVEGLVRGQPATWIVDGLAPLERVYLLRGRATGPGVCPSVGGGLCLDITGAPEVLGTARADALGTAELVVVVPSSLPLDASTAFQAAVLRGPGNVDSAKSNPVSRRILGDFPRIGSQVDDLVITEVHANPAAVSDANGEWFEIHNHGDDAVDLQGVVVADFGTTSFTIDRPVVVDPGGFAVLSRQGDPSINGGLWPDYAWQVGFSLANNDDGIVLRDGGRTLDTVSWGPSTGLLVRSGESLSLAPSLSSASDNDEDSAWCLGTTAFGAGDLGSPGAENPACGVCGDGAVDPGELCDDGGPSSSCTATCETLSTCGDSSLDPGEDCDAGPLNGTDGAACARDCTDNTFSLALQPPLVFSRMAGEITDSRSMTLTDVDNDGTPDVMATTNLSGDAAILPGDGRGSFATILDLATSAPLTDVAVADLDGDGYPDVVGVGEYSLDLWIAWGSATGLETPVRWRLDTDFRAGDNRLVTTDLDGDGDADIVVTYPSRDEVVRVTNLGNRTFNDRPIDTSLAGAEGCGALVVGDLNEDGVADVVTLGDNGTLAILLADGQGHLLSPSVHGTDASGLQVAQDIAITDLDDDGLQDILVLDRTGGVLWLRNNGPTGFASAALIPTTGQVHDETAALAVGDVDGDGHDDVVYLRALAQDLVVARGGSGLLLQTPVSSPLTEPFDAQQAELEDLDGDGDLDLTLTDDDGMRFVVLHNDGQGSFTEAGMASTETTLDADFTAVPSRHVLADVTGDGVVDLVAGVNDLRTALVRPGNGRGAFLSPAYRTEESSRAWIADVDDDGLADWMRWPNGVFTVDWQRPDGGFDTHVMPGLVVTDLATGDIDLDGHTDIVAYDTANYTFNWLRNNGDRSFTNTRSSNAGSSLADLTLVDVSGDGHVDMLAIKSSADEFSVFFGDGTGAFTPPVVRSTLPPVGGSSSPSSLEVADIDEDGLPDVLVLLTSGDIMIFEGTGGGGFAAGRPLYGQWPSSNLFGSASGLTVADVDLDGTLDLAAAHAGRGAVSIWRGFGQGVFAAPFTVDVSTRVRDVGVGDLNGDGQPDLVVGNIDDPVVHILLAE